MARWWGALVALAVLVWTGIGLGGPWVRLPGMPAVPPPKLATASFTGPSPVIPLALPALEPMHGVVERVLGYRLRVPDPALASSGIPIAATPYGVVYVNPSQGSPVMLPDGKTAVTSPRPFHIMLSPVVEPGSGVLPGAHSLGASLPNRYQGNGTSGWWALSFVRATGPWLVYRETALPVSGLGAVQVGAINLATGQELSLTRIPGGAAHLRVGSGRVIVGTADSVSLYQLPDAGSNTTLVTEWPASWFLAMASSITAGYDTSPTVRVPGLPTSPPATKQLAAYQVGSWALPFAAPKGWLTSAPVTQHGVTTVTVTNPRHHHDWVQFIVDPDESTLAVASLPGAVPSVMAAVPTGRGVWLTDVSVGFSLPDPTPHFQLNAVIYPAPGGGTDEVLVSLPAKLHSLATEILNSVGLPS